MHRKYNHKEIFMSLRWAEKVSCRLIARLYCEDAEGYENEALADEVGTSLYLRCESIIAVSYGFEKKIISCPVCGKKINLINDVFNCDCGNFSATWDEFHRSYKNKQLYGANALPVFIKFINDYPLLKNYREKMRAIDTLIHSFHILHSARTGYQNSDPSDEINVLGRPAGANLIEGTLTKVVIFLNELSSPSNEKWREIVKRANVGSFNTHDENSDI
jgi:hypothetical protein